MKAKPTSQFVAVNGTRENSHPSCEGRSEVSRMYLFPISMLASNKASIRHTGLRAQWYFLQNQTIGSACLNPSRATCLGQLGSKGLIARLQTNRAEGMCSQL
jgi:hypothetical protein